MEALTTVAEIVWAARSNDVVHIMREGLGNGCKPQFVHRTQAVNPSKPSFMYQLKKLAKAGNETPLLEFKKCKGHAECRQFGLRLRVDTAGAFCMAKETSSVGVSNKTKKLSGFWSRWELATRSML